MTHHHSSPEAKSGRTQLGGYGLAVFAIVLVLPRMLRIAYPQVWIEDESYLNGAFMISQGGQPYIDFPLPHFPLVDILLAGVFFIFGASIQTAELLTQSVVFACSAIVFALGKRLGGIVCGITAAIIFAFSSLLFRYHVFEREIYLLLPILAANWLALDLCGTRKGSKSLSVCIGILLWMAIMCKLTAVAHITAVLSFVAIRSKRKYEVVMIGFTVVMLSSVTFTSLYGIYGEPLLVQVFLFRICHAGFYTLTERIELLRQTMDVSLVLGLFGGITALWNRQWRTWVLPLCQVGCVVFFMVILNHTLWPHNVIELLPWLCVFGGQFVSSMVKDAMRNRKLSWRTGISAAVVVLLLIFVIPLINAHWGDQPKRVYGLGYMPRKEIADMADYVRMHAPVETPVVVPPIIAFQANRIEWIPYPELAGTIMELQAQVNRKGLLGAVQSCTISERDFWENVAMSRRSWLPQLEQDIAAGRVPLVINFSPHELFPVMLFDFPDTYLQRHGYQLGHVTPSHRAWIRQ